MKNFGRCNHLTPVASLVLLCAGIGLHGNSEAAEPYTAEVVSVAGKAERRLNVSAPWAEAQIKQLLYSGNFVRTLDDSALALLFADKSQLRLSRNSMFEIKNIGDGKTTDTDVSLLKGKSWMQSKAVPDKLRIASPSGMAAIHGTEWVMEVDDDGTTTVSVLTGEVEFTNALGSVRIQRNEQAVTEVGHAPQKRILVNPRERVQWVSSLRADGTWLFGSDAALAVGDFAKARQLLQQGAIQHPNDDRIPAQLARIALLSNDWQEARRIVQDARQRFPASVEIALVGGELARLEGDGATAVREFADSAARADADYRTWHGLGKTYSEQENFTPARAALQRARDLSPQLAAPWADLGALEIRTHRLEEANQSINHALDLVPDDYVAWTSRGILLLTQGETEAALEALLKASLLEPRYAKAQIHAAIAWYQLGRLDAAMAALAKAKDADPNDPLPYFYEAQMQRDALNPIAAIAAAQGARERFPFMKSLAPIATDKQGSSSLGAAYALFGLESWAKRLSAQTQHPFFAGSYLFAAERASDPLLRNSALVQGYLTDPTLFGASPQRSTLLPRPAGYVAAEFSASRANTTNAFSSNTPSFIANGYSVAPIPIAGFVQWDQPRYSFGASTPSLITALGLRPHAQWGVFVYRDEFRPRMDDMAINTASDRIAGNVVRTDIGTQWQIDPTKALWLRAGQGSDSTVVNSNVRSWDHRYQREDKDAGIRFTTLLPQDEWTLGYESGQSSKPTVTQTLGTNTNTTIFAATASDSTRWFASWKGKRGDWQWQAGADYSDFQLNQSGSSVLDFVATGRTTTLASPTLQRQWAGWSPSWGMAWNASPHSTYRLAWQTGVRPANAVSLASMDTVGIPLDIAGVQAGGSFKRLRAQGEWELAGNSYLTAFADHRQIDNLHDAAGNLLNPSASLSQYDRLRQQGANSTDLPESLEASPNFASGTVVSTGLVWEQIARGDVSWSASYIHTRTSNAMYPLVALPYFPKHTLGLGVTWFAPQSWVLHAQLTGRSERTMTDTGSQSLDADWDLSLRATWQDSSKRQLFEVFSKGLARKDQSALLGFRAVWRY